MADVLSPIAGWCLVMQGLQEEFYQGLVSFGPLPKGGRDETEIEGIDKRGKEQNKAEGRWQQLESLWNPDLMVFPMKSSCLSALPYSIGN